MIPYGNDHKVIFGYNIISQNEINDLFLQFWCYLRILAILDVACHVQLSAIDFKNHPNAHATSLAIIIQLYMIRNLPRAEVTSSQIFIFLLLKSVQRLNFNPRLRIQKNVNRNLVTTVGKLIKFATHKPFCAKSLPLRRKLRPKNVNFRKNRLKFSHG